MNNKLIEKDMFLSFEVNARWSLDKENGVSSYGLLKYDDNQDAIIEISPAFCDEMEQFDSPSVYDIYGVCEHGEIIHGTGYRVGSTFNRPGLSTEKITF